MSRRVLESESSHGQHSGPDDQQTPTAAQAEADGTGSCSRECAAEQPTDQAAPAAHAQQDAAADAPSTTAEGFVALELQTPAAELPSSVAQERFAEFKETEPHTQEPAAEHQLQLSPQGAATAGAAAHAEHRDAAAQRGPKHAAVQAADISLVLHTGVAAEEDLVVAAAEAPVLQPSTGGATDKRVKALEATDLLRCPAASMSHSGADSAPGTDETAAGSLNSAAPLGSSFEGFPVAVPQEQDVTASDPAPHAAAQKADKTTGASAVGATEQSLSPHAYAAGGHAELAAATPPEVAQDQQAPGPRAEVLRGQVQDSSGACQGTAQAHIAHRPASACHLHSLDLLPCRCGAQVTA